MVCGEIALYGSPLPTPSRSELGNTIKRSFWTYCECLLHTESRRSDIYNKEQQTTQSGYKELCHEI